MTASQAAPAVSIILPTYNRAGFLPQAFASIQSQQFTAWELIVVDDGSTDDTGELVKALTAGWSQPVRYYRQENQGAYGARNTGLDLARGEFIAFFDSDDIWLPHHVGDCVEALATNPDVDWVYAACQIVEFTSGRELAASSFYDAGRPRPFLELRVRHSGELRVIEDPAAVECQLSHGLYCGLQCSVIRRAVFAGYRFEANSRNEAEDQLVTVRALAAGHRLAYLDDIHVVYQVHGENSSAAGPGSVEKHLRIYRALVEGYERLPREMRLTPAQTRALNRRLGRHYFWNLGYFLFQHPGRGGEALAMFRRGLRLWPWNPYQWKTYLWAWIRTVTGLGLSRPSAPAVR